MVIPNYSKIVIVAYAFLISCGNETNIEKDFPSVRTVEVTEINKEGILFQGYIAQAGNQPIQEWGFVWDIGQNPVIDLSDWIAVPYIPGQSSFQFQLKSNLVNGGIYYMKAYAKTSDILVYGQVVSFVNRGDS